MEKKCINCGEVKSLLDYYKHSEMRDGTVNKCKLCCKQQSKERQSRLSNSKDWVEKERQRGREKYRRLNYKEKQKQSKEKYPWKNISKYKNTRKWFESKFGVLDKMIELHHWSYNDSNLRDVILLNRSSHKRLHSHLLIDVEKKCYRVKSTNELLDTKDKHIQFIKSLGYF